MTRYISTGIVVTFSGLAGELVDVDLGGEKTSSEQVTHQASANQYHEYLPGFTDPGECTLAIAWDPDATAPSRRTVSELLITWPSGSTKKFSAQAFVTQWGSIKGKLGTKMVNDVTFKLTGPPNWAATS